MDIRVFKLNTGDEIIADVTDVTDESLTLNKPRIIAVHPVAAGQMQVALVPFAASNPDSSVIMKCNAIVGEIVNPSQEIQDGYLEQTSGIVLS